jgi:non-homologous end joining protein Ku
MKMVCPSCKNSLLDQVYTCQAGCHPSANAPAKHDEGWTVSEIGSDRVRVEGKGKTATLVPVPGEEIEAAKATTFEKGEFALDIHPAEQVEAVTYPSGNIYAFIPDKADQVYAMLLREAGNAKRAIIGILNLRGTENLYRLVEYRGTLRVVELLRPEETAVFEPLILPTLGHKEQDTFNQLVEAVEDDFDAEQYSSSQLTNLKQLLAAKAGGVAPTTPVTAAPKKPTDTTDALTAALAAAKASKVKGKGGAKSKAS